MSDGRLVVRFPNSDIDEANRYARSLADEISELSEPDVKEVNVDRENPEAQDFGATLVLVLGTAAVTAVAKGIKSWLARNSGATVEILKNGSVIAKHLDSKDAAEIAKAMSEKTAQTK